jgi:hypothetical protein
LCPTLFLHQPLEQRVSPFPPTPFCRLLPFPLSQQEQRVFPSTVAPAYRPVPLSPRPLHQRPTLLQPHY